MKKLILIDGNSILHRAFHAIPPIHTSTGQIVNAVYGFSSTLIGILRLHEPDYIAVAFDMKGKTFRHEKYEDYKATRVKAPDELYEQIPIIKEVVKAFEIPIFELKGYEADDLLGTMAVQAESESDLKTYIFTSDRDAMQLVTEKINVICPISGVKKVKIYEPGDVEEKYGLRPDQITDMKALQGDSSDNIKGIAGIGVKTARDLLQKYQTIENIYNHLDELKPAAKRKMEEGRQDAAISKELATIITDAPMKLKVRDCAVHEFDADKVRSLFRKLEFSRLLKQFDTLDRNFIARKKIENNPAQASLF
ncbi:hypothetical protein GF354_05055 [Candidatus Peregrinibacteria bacterium]|nr:hypothetical protein [Candidatus Peregrinibacteria bacterium]